MAQISPRALRTVIIGLLTAAGADSTEAETVATVLGWADGRQRYPQGAVWVDVLTARLEAGTLHSPATMDTVRHSPCSSNVRAGGGFGHVAGVLAVERAIEHADEVGIGLAAVTSSSHFGAAGYYASRIADAGFLGLAMTNAYPKVAAPGGTRPVLGTNPLAFSVPVTGEACIVGDLSSGALAGSRVRDAIARRLPLPPGSALDADGRPTTDPGAMEAGGIMLPAAGPKGFALGLFVELFTSALGGGALGAEMGSMFDTSRPAETSHLVLALRPFDDEFPRRAAQLLQQVTQGQPGVRIPGALRGGDRHDRQDVIDLPADSVHHLQRAAQRVGVDLPAELS